MNLTSWDCSLKVYFPCFCLKSCCNYCLFWGAADTNNEDVAALLYKETINIQHERGR